MKRPEIHRYLITNVRNVAFCPEVLEADVLLVDNSLNMATQTGIGVSVYIPKTDFDRARKEAGLRSVKSMIGYPVNCKTTYDTSNVLGRSAYHSMG